MAPMAPVTLCYLTSRVTPCIEWFAASLEREAAGAFDGIRVLVVDRLLDPHGGTEMARAHRQAYLLERCGSRPDVWRFVAPKPSAWQGPHRQTREDWFAAANARNTGICLCETEWIVFVDDLSVLMPGWLSHVYEAMRHKRTITCGAYRKVKGLVVDAGLVSAFTPGESGQDSREKHAGGVPRPCGPEWMFGCSLAAPVEAFLEINGWDERCDGLSFEDVITGINLAKKGWKFRYNPRMMTWESEERHHTAGGSMRRSDYGVSPRDKSHRILELAQMGDGWSPVDFGEGGDLRDLRQRALAGGEFPRPTPNQREWFTSSLLSQLS